MVKYHQKHGDIIRVQSTSAECKVLLPLTTLTVNVATTKGERLFIAESQVPGISGASQRGVN